MTQTLAVMVMRGLTFQPWVLIALMRGIYLSCFVLMAWFVFLSCVNVNSIIWIVRLGKGMNDFSSGLHNLMFLYKLFIQSIAMSSHITFNLLLTDAHM